MSGDLLEDLATALFAALKVGNDSPATRLDVFDGVVVATNDSDGRAHPYAALYLSAGNLRAQRLCDTQDLLDLPFQVTAAGGDPARARRAISRVRARLSGVELDVAGRTVRVVEEPDYQAGPIREDRDVTPSRWYTPLLFRTQAVTA